MRKDILKRQIVKAIASKIALGDYARGKVLPAERKLAAQFGVSRGTLRKAIAELAELDMVEIKAGNGIYVKQIRCSNVPSSILPLDPQTFSVGDVVAARKALEQTAIETTAVKISQSQLKELEQLVENMSANIEKIPEYIAYDLKFHSKIVDYSGNSVLIAAYKAIEAYNRYLHLSTTQNSECEEISLKHHYKILAALKKQNPNLAKKALSQHLDEVEQDWKEYSSKKTIQLNLTEREKMQKNIYDTKEQMGAAAANAGTELIREAIRKKASANIILATGASQFDMLANLTAADDIDWSKVTMFHLDEYIGIEQSHPASFRKYLKERFVDKLPSLKCAHFVNGNSSDPEDECNRLNRIIEENPIDVAFVGIGENCHLAFNDPPADFETEEPFIIVRLDELCRKQQLGEGWFPTLDDVPVNAISMSIRQILKSRNIIVTVPDERKAQAVKDMLEQPISNQYPASILRSHSSCKLFLDNHAASLI